MRSPRSFNQTFAGSRTRSRLIPHLSCQFCAKRRPWMQCADHTGRHRPASSWRLATNRAQGAVTTRRTSMTTGTRSEMPRPFWLESAAEEFWRAAGEVEPFPRNLEAPVLWALPLFILKVPRLTLSDVRAKLADYDIAFGVGGPNRSLYGCLVAFAGKGVVMLDGSEAPDELRFSLAHEVGHF